jgi:hypothetical protein
VILCFYFRTLPTPFLICQRVALSADSNKPKNFPMVFFVPRMFRAPKFTRFGVLEKVIACLVSTFNGASRTACRDFCAMPSDLF